METKQDMAVHWMEKSVSKCTTCNRAHLLDLVDISIGQKTVDFLVTIVFSVVHKSV